MLGPLSLAHAQFEPPPPGGPRREAHQSVEVVRGAYYQPGHLYWYASGPGRGREKRALAPLLSTRQAVVGFTWTPATQASVGPKRGRLDALRQRPPGGLPPIADVRQCDEGPTHVAALVTFARDLGPGQVLSTVNALRGLGRFDFVSPVFFLPEKMAYAFPRFEADFLPVSLIVDGEAAVRRFNAASHVTVAAIAGNRYTLDVGPDSPLSVLALALRYAETPWLVKATTLTWRSVTTPISVHAELRTAGRLPAVDVRDPIEYVLTIDRDHDVTVLPEMTSQTEVKNWLLRAVALPEEIVDLKEVTRSSESLNPSRARDTITFVFLVSKAGRFELPPFLLKYSRKDAAGIQKVETVSTERMFPLTVDAHVPRDLVGLPGSVFPMPSPAPGRPLRLGALGGGAMLAGGLLLLVAGAPALVRWWRIRRLQRIATRARSIREDSYRTLWHRVDHGGARLDPGDPGAERAWLRDAGKAVRGLLGDRLFGDETALLGGVGAMPDELREIVERRVGEAGARVLARAVAVLDEIEEIADAAEPGLSSERVMDLRERVRQLMNGTAA
jgi:hypothetical protein